MNLGSMGLEQLVALVTREVMTALPVGGAAWGCGGCEHCQGRCVQDCPGECRLAVQAGAARLSAAPGTNDVAGDLARLIDHTLLKPEATEEQIVKLCEEASANHFATVCVNPTWVRLCARELRGSGVGVCTVVGFPLGATLPEVKAFEAERSIGDGASEIDMVINVGALKSHQYRSVAHDIAGVVAASHGHNALVKVIIEAVLLTDEEKVEACALAKSACADYVKTSTGFAAGGATVADVALMRRVVGPELGVKAAGGVRNLADARGMVEAGATRIGASAGVKIVQEARGQAGGPALPAAATATRSY